MVVLAQVFPYSIIPYAIRTILMQHFLKVLQYCVQDFLQDFLQVLEAIL